MVRLPAGSASIAVTATRRSARRIALVPSTSLLNASVIRSTRVPTGCALGLIAVQQAGRGRAADGLGELPAKVHRIADAGVHALPTERRVHVGGVAREEHPPLPGSGEPACAH